jgi:nucleotide sugar dehydrogenase
MGLPLACQFASRGASVTACDINAAVVGAINQGRCPIDEPGVPELLSEVVLQGRLRATCDVESAVRQSEVVVVIVPAMLTEEREIDLSMLREASRQVGRGLREGAMVCYETTMPLGGTRQFLRPILEQQSGLEAGRDFDLVFSPERVKSQAVLRHLTQNPKIVGGINPASARRGAEFYAEYLGAPVTNLGTLEASELAKLAGMVYRDVTIAVANELAAYAEAAGVELGPVIAAANTDGESHLLSPGIGVGGHCTPVYPYFLIREAERRGTPVTLVERARRVNDRQVVRMLDRVEREWGKLAGKGVMILGLGFRPQVKEHAYSTAFPLRAELVRRGAKVSLHDPLYRKEEIEKHGFEAGEADAAALPEVLVLNTAHAEYLSVAFGDLARRGVKVVVDGRNAWQAEDVREAGIAYFGVGRPSETKERRTVMVPVSRPAVGGDEAEAAAEVVRTGWVAQGPQVGAFEREFAEYVGARHACAVSSGTAALHLALLAVGVGPGDEVVTVSHSFIATANAVRYCGARPVFVDVDPETGNMDPALLEAAITPRTRAILPAHQIGVPCDIEAIVAVGKGYGIPVVEDAACAVGSEVRIGGMWERVGRPHGTVACFSFHPRKILTCGEGGMITTADAEIDRRVRLLRQHAMSIPDLVRHGATEVQFETYPETGFNYRMTDIQAAVGRAQLRRLPQMLRRQAQLAERYMRAIREIPGLSVPEVPEYARTNYQSYAVRVGAEFPMTRDALMQRLLDRGISTRRGVMNAHQEPAYSGGVERRLSHSEMVRDTTVLLPLYAAMSDEEQGRVIEELRAAAGAAEVTKTPKTREAEGSVT